MQVRSAILFISLATLVSTSRQAEAQFPPAPISATTIPAVQLIQPAELVALLKSNTAAPLVLHVGPRIFFDEAHIPGSKYAGPGLQAAGLDLLGSTVAPVPKDKFIVLYCGCCPWNRCPNVGPAFQRLRELGFTHVKVLYLANNFGDDWVSKGYPTAGP